MGRKEYKTQLYFKDDNKFRFIRREVEYSCLVEKDKGNLVRGWKHFFGNQFYFPGYRGISADTITLGFARDIILDPFNKIPTGEAISEKPKAKDLAGLKKWIAKIAENQRHIYRSARKSTFKEDFINWSLMGVLVVMILMWAISFFKGIYG
jgi:hypothetical protein